MKNFLFLSIAALCMCLMAEDCFAQCGGGRRGGGGGCGGGRARLFGRHRNNGDSQQSYVPAGNYYYPTYANGGCGPAGCAPGMMPTYPAPQPQTTVAPAPLTNPRLLHR